MNISLNWLTDYVDVSMPVAELGELLARIGLPLEGVAETDADIVLDVEVTSNRPDCLGHIGIAREIAAATGAALKLPDLANVPVAGDVHQATSVEVLDPHFCPRYTARVIRGVKVGPSPAWMVERLEAVGLRSINNVVDATNYVLMEYSQPLHAFDLDTLAEQRIVVRRARDGETIVAIDGSKHELRDWMGVIADARRPVAVAGVMGGLETEVSDATADVLIESAQFDPLLIRRTSRQLNLMSDSSYRFERGVDPVALEQASLRCCQLILQIAGGELLAGLADAWAKPYEPAKVALRPARCNQLLGIEVPVDKQLAVLRTLGLEPDRKGERIVCTIPPHRADLYREVDLIEEVGRIHGYDAIPTGGQVTHEVHGPSPVEQARQRVAEVLNAAGYYEAITFTFIDAEEARLFGWDEPLAVDKRIRKTTNALRQGLLPSLLRARKANQDAGNEQVSLYELSAVFPPGGSADALPAEHFQIGLLTDGDVRDVRGAIEALVRAFHPAVRTLIEPADVPGLAQGAAAKVRIGLDGQEPAPLGVMGKVDAKVCGYFGLTHTPAGAMLRFDALTRLAGQTRSFQPVPRFPGIQRDLSVVMDESVTYQQLSQVIAEAAGQLCEDMEYVGAYRGKQVGKGSKSLTLRLRYRHPDRTLRHEEVDESVDAVVAELKKRFHATLRT